MKVTVTEHTCRVEREEGDPKFSGVVNAAGESRLLYYVKKILNERGYDLIKKRMWKDGHMVDDMQQYLRTHSSESNTPHIAIYNDAWAIKGADEYLNKYGYVELRVIPDYFGVQPDCAEQIKALENPPTEVDEPDPYFDRLDICEAHYVLEGDYNSGGWLHERPSNVRRGERNGFVGEATHVQLHRMGFKPRPNLRYETLTENGKAIYRELVKRYNLPWEGEDAH